ncbi:DUF4376 domain-containing protein [Bradyrhizobium sp. SZCCHNS3053]|uniref:DUF4376 domain-containing protein n=1 Tax=Bradyrhizobium sp. SZCCHNS3053 TaxID=3057322 RepID=UPI002915F7CB|nr:DUF4376 domain-containing protein [Bradyrhizobium sp. SZCCHNS3053]
MLKRYAIVDATTNRLITVVEYDQEPSTPLPGFGDGVIAVQNDLVGRDWTWDGAQLVPPPVPEPTIGELIAYANVAQWQKATGGFPTNINGQEISFPTSTESLALINGKLSRFQQPNPPTSVLWQVSATEFITISADDFSSLAVSVADFVQSTFDHLQIVLGQILNGTITTKSQIDTAFA